MCTVLTKLAASISIIFLLSFKYVRLQIWFQTPHVLLIIPTLWSQIRERCLSIRLVNSSWTSTEKTTKWCHLAVGINYRSKQLPGASTAVHTQHAQDLQESQTPDGRGGKNIALRSSCQYRYRGNQHHDVWRDGKHNHRTQHTPGSQR